jgi:hypothetical protein
MFTGTRTECIGGNDNRLSALTFAITIQFAQMVVSQAP